MRGSPSAPVVPSPLDPEKKLKANDILEQLNPFVDPAGVYKYEEEPARPEFLLTANELKAGYYNLNTNNANKLARSEYHQKVINTSIIIQFYSFIILNNEHKNLTIYPRSWWRG